MRRRTTPGATTGHDHGVNATPLIDVVMCLIIFFLLVGRIAQDRGAAVRLPESARGHEEQAATILVVTVTALPPTPIAAGAPSAREGGFAAIGVAVEVDGETVGDSGALEKAVRGKLAIDAQASIQLRADRELSFAAVEPVLRAVGNAGAKSVRFATEKAG
jgi:biopolymer transport protein ExbD